MGQQVYGKVPSRTAPPAKSFPPSLFSQERLTALDVQILPNISWSTFFSPIVASPKTVSVW